MEINRSNKYLYLNFIKSDYKILYPTTYDTLPVVNPAPVLIINNLTSKISIESYKNVLKNKGGIYSFINTINGKQYIGSAKNFYIRLNEHLKNKKSNTNLQKAFNEHGLKNFNWVVYEYFSYKTRIVSSKNLIKLEASYIKAFDFSTLYNMKQIASNRLVCKQTNVTTKKITEQFKDKSHCSMYDSKHTDKDLVKIRKNRYSNGIGIYDLKNNLLHKFNNNVELANYLNVSKVTVGKYLNNELIYKNSYRFKPIIK